jgi:hypothetical protein
MPIASASLNEEGRYLNGINDRSEGWGHDEVINPDGPATPGQPPIVVPEDLRD